MTESHSPEQQLAALRHPAIVPLGQFQAAWEADGDSSASGNIRALLEAQLERDRPGGFRDFTVAQELDAIHTTADVARKAASIVDALQPLDAQERLDTLVRWRDMAAIGSTLRRKADESVQLQTAIQELGLQAKPILELSLAERYQIGQQMRAMDIPYHFPSLPGSENPDWQAVQTGVDKPLTLLPPLPQGASDAVRHSEDFALYNDAVKVKLLFLAAAEMSADVVGRDLLTGSPVAQDYRVNNVAEAQAYSGQLPPNLAGWRERGLMDLDLPDHFMGGFDRNYESVEQTAYVLAGDTSAEIANAYIDTYKPFYEFLDGSPAHQDQNAPLEAQKKARLEHRDFMNNRLPKAMRLFKGRILKTVVEAFSEARTPIHPKVEEKVRQFVAHTLSGGYGTQSAIYYRLQDVRSQPLTEAIPILQAIAAEDGFDDAGMREPDTR